MEDIYNYTFTLNLPNNSAIPKNFYSQEVSFLEDIRDDFPSYFDFTSLHLNPLNDPIDVWARGKFLLGLFKGASVLSYKPIGENYLSQQISLQRLYKGNQDITPINTFSIVPKIGFECLPEQTNQALIHIESYNRVSQLLKLSRLQEDVRNILMQIGHGMEWINLYSILDSVHQYAGQNLFNSMLSDAGLTREDVKAFKGTVNNFGLLYTEARHGELGYGVPTRTVTLIEARDIVVRLAFAYFHLKYCVA